jgi:hypothetical protein
MSRHDVFLVLLVVAKVRPVALTGAWPPTRCSFGITVNTELIGNQVGHRQKDLVKKRVSTELIVILPSVRRFGLPCCELAENNLQSKMGFLEAGAWGGS